MKLESLDLDLREYCVIRNPPPDAELRAMIRRGDAALFRGPSVVPLDHARSLPELRDMVAYFQDGASESGMGCFFRGQMRDYVSEDMWMVEPAGYRDLDYKLRLIGESEDIVRAIQLWEKALDQFKLPLSAGLRFSFSERHDPPKGLYRLSTASNITARFSTNPVFVAVLKHYGFATDCLDVTKSLAVALWFATHRAIRGADGLISFERRASVWKESSAAPEREQLRSMPSIYIYFESDPPGYPLFDLSALDALGTIAQRPQRQAAWSLPFNWIGPTPYVHVPGMAKIWSGDCPRTPSVVIKILFEPPEILEKTVTLTGEYLFPKNEPLYQAPLKADVPFLAKYS
jgi:hypothetical protein